MEKKPMDYVKAQVIDNKEYGLVLVKEETQLSVEVIMLDHNTNNVSSFAMTDDLDLAITILEDTIKKVCGNQFSIGQIANLVPSFS